MNPDASGPPEWAARCCSVDEAGQAAGGSPDAAVAGRPVVSEPVVSPGSHVAEGLIMCLPEVRVRPLFEPREAPW